MPEAMPGPGSEATWTPWRSDAPPPLDVPSNLVHVQRLGAGAYGEVHLYEDTESKDKDKVAVKWIRDFARSPLSGKRILREVRLLSALRHENLLTLTDLLPPPHPDFDDVCIVMPYMHLDLHKVIYSKMKLSESHSQAFVCQILRGLKYMHSAGVVHRDLKPSNVLVNRDCTLRIADFGLSRGRLSEEEDLTEYVMTRYYRALELLLVPWLYKLYFEQVDLWSVGCIHFEILNREPLFRGKDQVDMLKNIASTLGFSAERDLDWVPEKDRRDDRFKKAKEVPRLLRLPEEPDRPLRQLLPGASEACLDLINRLLDKVPSSRITASEAIAHEYLAHLHDPAGETVASKVFDWNFDSFEPTKRELKDRMYAECARRHPHIIERDQAWLRARGYRPGDRGRAGRAGGSAEDIGPKIGAELPALAGRPRLPRDGGGAFSPEAWAPGLPAAASVDAPWPQESWPWAPNPSPATAFPTPASAQSQQSQPPATRSKACQQQPADSTSQEVDLFDLGSLLNWLEWADVALLRFTWVLHADPAVLKNRRQELPPEAFLTVDELRPRAHLVTIIALSYGWADPANPDPNGDYAEMLKMWKTNFDVPDEECCALFWDHKSLYQHRIMPEWDGQRGTFEQFVIERRTAAEEGAFRRAMSGMQALYFHAKTMVLIATEVPTSGRNPRPYAERGWTAMEYAGACLTGKFKLVKLGGEVGFFDVGMVPMPIADFEDEVARRAFFRAEDAQDVIRMYQDGFEAYSRRADTLYVTISRDDPVNCQRLARALPAFVSLQQLGLRSYRYRGFSAFELHRHCELPEADPSADPRVAALDRALDDFAAKLQVTRGGAVTVVTCEGTTYVHASHEAVFTPSGILP